MTTRAMAKAQTRARLLELARETVREEGAPALSLRSVARRAGVASSAVYKHFEGRDALITTLLVESYERLATTLEAVAELGWRPRAAALRAWALANPHEFHLLYGTPIPGYAAPGDTVPAAVRVVNAFLPHAGSDRSARPELVGQLRRSAADLGVRPETLSWTLRELAQLVGLLTLELGGHLVGTADPADLLWDVTVARQVAGVQGAPASDD